MSTKTSLPNIKVPKFLNDVEKGDFAEQLYQQDIPQDKIGMLLNCSIPQVCNLRKLADMPLYMKKRVAREQISSTLVLDVMRANKDITVGEACQILERAYKLSTTGHITKKDVMTLQNKKNSITIMKKILKNYNMDNVKPERKEEFEVIRGLIMGKFDRTTLLRRYGLAS